MKRRTSLSFPSVLSAVVSANDVSVVAELAESVELRSCQDGSVGVVTTDGGGGAGNWPLSENASKLKADHPLFG